jgi:type I restriction enzyme M protein
MKNGAPHADEKAPNLATLIWQIADLLRGPYKPAQYGSVVLPFTVLRRLDCVLEPTKEAVLKAASGIKDLDNLRLDQRLKLERATSGFSFYNTSKFTMTTAIGDAGNVRANLEDYVAGFSPNVRDVFERYAMTQRLHELDERNLLYKVAQRFAADDVDLHPNKVSNAAMGSIFEELIRKFADSVDEKPGEHFTPRDAIALMVDLVLAGDEDLQTNPRPLRTIYDPTAGTGGMLSIAEDRIVNSYNSAASVTAYAQEINAESYAICKADMLIKGQDVANVVHGNTLTHDKFPDTKFDLMFSNPPYGYEWKIEQASVTDEHERGDKGRFGPGLPRISDGQMLFLMHLVSKMQPTTNGGRGSRIAIVMNGSPLFTGGAGSGESDIRKYLFEHDLVEAIVGLPTEMFYNTGIATYVWILTNKKSKDRIGFTQLIDGTGFFEKMRKSLGSKRRYLSDADIARIVKLHGDAEDGEHSKMLPNESFGYRTIVVERPLKLNFQVSPERLALLPEQSAFKKGDVDLDALETTLTTIGPKLFTNRDAFTKAVLKAVKGSAISLKPAQLKAILTALSEPDEDADVCRDSKGNIEPDADLRDTENVPLGEDIQAYFEREVLPHVPDAWIDHNKTKVGYEVPFTRYFYKYLPPRPLELIDSDLAVVTAEIVQMLSEVSA